EPANLGELDGGARLLLSGSSSPRRCSTSARAARARPSSVGRHGARARIAVQSLRGIALPNPQSRGDLKTARTVPSVSRPDPLGTLQGASNFDPLLTSARII